MKRSPSEAKKILQARAEQLARVEVTDRKSGALLELLEFKLAKERYALESRHVQGVHPFRDLTPLPGTPPFLLGIVNVRSRILPVLDLKKFFGLPEQGVTDLHRIIIVRGNDMELGILADVIVGVREIALESLQPSLPTLSGVKADYLKGVTAERLIVIDIETILADPKIIVDEEVEN